MAENHVEASWFQMDHCNLVFIAVAVDASWLLSPLVVVEGSGFHQHNEKCEEAVAFKADINAKKVNFKKLKRRKEGGASSAPRQNLRTKWSKGHFILCPIFALSP